MSRRVLALVVGVIVAIGASVGVWLLRGSDAGPSARGFDGGVTAPGARPRPELAVQPRRGTGDLDVGGRVVDVAGGPVFGAAVTAELELGPGVTSMPGVSKSPAVVAVTLALGEFVLEGMAPGRYRLVVEGPGIITSEVRFVEVPAPDGLSLVVAREVAIDGVVTDPSTGSGRGAGAPVRDVEVSLAGTAGVQHTRTNQSGQFRFEHLPEGVYRVWAARGDRAAPTRRVERLGAGPFEAVELVMGPAAIVRGRVVDAATGDGVAADVQLTADQPDEPPRRAASDASGNVTVEGVPIGGWTAEAFAVGYVAEESIHFEAGGAFAPELRLRQGAIIEGRVVTAIGAPVEGAQVSVRSGGQVVASEASLAEKLARVRGSDTAVIAGQRFVPRGELGVLLGPIPFPPPAGASGVHIADVVVGDGDADAGVAAPVAEVRPELEPRFVTDRDGRFRVTGLPSGRYHVIASHADFADGRSRELPLTAGAAIRDLELVVHPGVMITGTVTDTGGAVVVGATVIADVEGDEHARLQGVTGTDGVYTVGPVAVDVILRASAVRHGEASRRLTIEPGPIRTERREDFVLDRADAVLAGRVTDASGFPVRGATLEARRKSASDPSTGLRTGVLGTAVSDDTGRYQIDGLPAGAHQLRVVHDGFPPRVFEVDTARVANVELAYGGGIEAEVRDAHTRAPIGAALVVATGPGGDEARASSGVDGELELVPLAAGRWTVAASATGYAASRQTVDVAAGGRPGEITVRDLRLELARGATLAGIVRDANGDRVRGARVAVGGVTATTDEQGRFRLRDVPTGEVELTASKGDARAREPLDLSPGDERVTMELTLE